MMPEFPDHALVVFTGGHKTPWFLRWLHRRWRHCFLMLPFAPDSWMLVDPGSNGTVVALFRGFPADEMDRLGPTAMIWAPMPAEMRPVPAPFALYTCVEEVKRFLGIHDGWIFTPRQLWRHLTRELIGDE